MGRERAAAVTAQPPAGMMWGVAYRTAGMAEGDYITSYGPGDWTEDDARWMAERYQAEQSHIVAAWATSRERF